MSLLDILNQALQQAQNQTQGQAQNQPQINPELFEQASQHATPDMVSTGLAEAFRSDQTPAFGDMVGQLFGQSNGQQQAGALNQILGSLGPAALATIAGGVLGKVMAPGATQLTPAQAGQLSPDQVRDIATQAEAQQPGVIDQLSRFYAEHPTLVKTVGSTALLIALSKMKQAMERR